MDNDLKAKATKGVFWSSVEKFSLQGVQFLIGIVMARLLTPKDYGIIGMLAVFLALSQVFIDGGFTNALIQKNDRTEKDYATVFYINMIVSIIFYLLLYIGAPFIAAFYEQPILIDITRVLSLNLIINSLVAVHRTQLIIAMDFKTQSKISVISAIVSGSVGIFFAYIGFAVWALVFQTIISSILNVLLTFYFVKWFPSERFSKASFQRLFRFGSKLMIASIISRIYTNLYYLVIGKKFNSVQLGFYTRADQFAQLSSGSISEVLSKVSFPLLSQIQDDDEKLISVYRKYVKIASFVVFPCLLCLGGIAEPLITMLLTEKWIASASLLQILVLVYLWDSVIFVNLNLLKVKGRTDLLLKLEIAKKSIAFTILFISSFYNLTIICWGLVLYSLISFYMNTYYTNKILRYGFKDQVSDILPYLLLSLLVGLEALLISSFFLSPLLSLVLSFIICPITYIGLSYKFKAMPLMYLLETLKLNVSKNKRS